MSAEPLSAEKLRTVAALVVAFNGPCKCVDHFDRCPRCEAEDVLPTWASRLLATVAAREGERDRAWEEARLWLALAKATDRIRVRLGDGRLARPDDLRAEREAREALRVIGIDPDAPETT